MLLIVLLAFTAILASRQGRTVRPGEMCQSELHKANLALEAYASDNMGKYPSGLKDAEKYFPYPLRCLDSPAGRYLYEVSNDRLAYTIKCTGVHGRSRDFPCVVNERGPFPPKNPLEQQ